MKKLCWAIGVLAFIVGVVVLEPSGTILGKLRGEPFFQGRSGSSWSAAIISEDPTVKEAARKALEDATGAEAVPVLDFLVRQTKGEAEVRWTAAELLGKKGTAARSSAGSLIQALQDSDAHVRSVAATALSTIEAPASDVVPALKELVEREPKVPVLRALSVFGADAAPALERLRAILNDKALDSEVRWNAARTIGKMHEAAADAIPDLVANLTDPADRLREHAAEALGDIGPPAAVAVPELTKALEDPFVKVRRDSVRSLGQIGPAARTAIPAIEKLLNDPEAIVKDAAKTALERLSSTEENSKPQP